MDALEEASEKELRKIFDENVRERQRFPQMQLMQQQAKTQILTIKEAHGMHSKLSLKDLWDRGLGIETNRNTDVDAHGRKSGSTYTIKPRDQIMNEPANGIYELQTQPEHIVIYQHREEGRQRIWLYDSRKDEDLTWYES